MKLLEVLKKKCGRRKYNSDHRDEGVSVFGGIESRSERKFHALSIVPNQRGIKEIKYSICAPRIADRSVEPANASPLLPIIYITYRR